MKSDLTTLPWDVCNVCVVGHDVCNVCVIGQAHWLQVFQDSYRDQMKRPPRKRWVVRSLQDRLRDIAMDYHWTTCKDFTCRDEVDAYLNNSVLVRGHDYLVDFKPPPHLSSPPSSSSSSSSLHEGMVVEEENNNNDDGGHYSRMEELPLLPSLPLFTLLQVAVYPTCRGLLLDLAQLLCPTDSDYDNFISHKMKYRERINLHKKTTMSKDNYDATTTTTSDVYADKLSKNWRGYYSIASSLRRNGRRRQSRNSANTSEGSSRNDDDDGAVGVDDNDEDDGVWNGQFKRRSIIYRTMVGVITSGQQPHMNNNSFAIGVCSAIALNAMFRQYSSRRRGGGGQYKHHPQAHMLVLFRNDRSPWIRPALLTVI